MPYKSAKVKLTRAQEGVDGIAVSEALLESLGAPRLDQATLKVGAKSVSVPVSNKRGSDVVAISPKVASDLYLSLPQTLRIRWEPERQALCLGPIVAIFAAKKRRSGRRALFGVRTGDLKHLIAHGRALGMVAFVAAPDGIEEGADYVEGYVRSGKRWVKRRLPLPDVVYDRVQARSWERRASTQRAKAVLQAIPDVHYFNEGFFDKWSIYQRMSRHERLVRYIPETRQLTGPASLQAFLDQHSSVYVKPTEGSQGKGVVRVRRTHTGYEWRHGRRIHGTTRFDALYKGITRIQRGRRYIVQQDLHLATFGGAPFDVRILMQKTGDGEWARTKTYARVAPQGRVTSNLSRGGTAFGLAYVLRKRFKRNGRRVAAKIRTASLEIVTALEEVLDGPLGEVGLDLGVDRKGQVWLIEVNAKPFRKITDAGPKRQVWRSFHRPMAYANYIAGF